MPAIAIATRNPIRKPEDISKGAVTFGTARTAQI